MSWIEKWSPNNQDIGATYQVIERQQVGRFKCGETLQHLITIKMLKISVTNSTRIVVSQSTRFQKRQERVGVFIWQFVRQLLEDVQRKCLELSWSGDWFLHHDNAPIHTAMNHYWASHGWSVDAHPLYWLDLAPCVFFLFLRIKVNLKRTRFDYVEMAKTASQRVLIVESFQSWIVPDLLTNSKKKKELIEWEVQLI